MAKRVFGIPELAGLVSDQVLGRRDMRSLASVNRMFHDILSPRLWSTLRWDAANINLWLDPRKRWCFLKSRHMAHVRAIEYAHHAWDSGGMSARRGHYYDENDKHWVGSVSDALAETVRHCVELYSFNGRNFRVSHDLIDALAAHTSLTALRLDFLYEMEPFLGGKGVSNGPAATRGLLERHFGHPERHLSAFSALKKLTLRNIWGDMDSWEQNLAKTLLANPHLEHLELSIDSDTKMLPCIDSICKAYDELRTLANHDRPAETQIPRLQLRALLLRDGFMFPSRKSLAHLTDLSKMEHVYLHNTSGPAGAFYWVDWGVLSPDVMPNLRYIHLYHLDLDAWTQIPDIVRNRVQATENTGAPSVVGFLAEEDRVTEVLERSEPATWSILDICTRIGPVPMISLPWVPDLTGFQSNLEALKKCDWLTHLSFGWWEAQTTGRARDSPTMLFVREWLSVLVRHEAVRITFISCYDILGEEKRGDIAAAMAEACPTLTYIQIQGTSWTVRRHRQEEPRATLVRLEAWELADEQPEFFGFGCRS